MTRKHTLANPAAAFTAILAAAALTAAPSPAAAVPWSGDPDTPALGAESVAASRSFLAHDLDRLVLPQSLHLLLAGGGLALLAHGQDDADRMESMLDRPSVDVGIDVGNTYGHGTLLAGGALALYAAGAALGESNLRGAGGEMARSLVYTGVLVSAVKLGVNRTRPNGGAYSFPSGHTAAAFAVAPVLAHRFGRLAAIPAYVLAVGTGLGRVEDRKHYLSDVLAGAAIGLAVGRAVTGDGAAGGSHANATGPRFGIGPGGAEVTVHF